LIYKFFSFYKSYLKKLNLICKVIKIKILKLKLYKIYIKKIVEF